MKGFVRVSFQKICEKIHEGPTFSRLDRLLPIAPRAALTNQTKPAQINRSCLRGVGAAPTVVVIGGVSAHHFTGFGCVRVRVARGFPQPRFPNLYFQYFCVFHIFIFLCVFHIFHIFCVMVIFSLLISYFKDNLLF